jgi:hypothetical protein
MYHPFDALPKRWYMVLTFFSLLPLFLVDMALWLRMLVVYPYRSTPRLRFAAIFAPTLVFKLVRLRSWPVFVMEVARETHSYSRLYLMFTADLAVVLDNVCVRYHGALGQH